MKIYLAGPISGCNLEDCREWREYIKKQLKSNSIIWLDPLLRDVTPMNRSQVVDLDKSDVENSDYMVVNWAVRSNNQSIGTAMEMLHAFNHGVPILCVVPKDFPDSIWLDYHCTFKFESIDLLIGYLRDIL